MWLGQFQFQSNPDADSNARDYTIAYSSSNAKPFTNAYTDTGSVERYYYREST